ncbi:hypothetical protein ACS8E9_16935 [Pseudomonas neustonica]|uniref:Uncharacterized protein n=1 Tax=Pseudomonas neustonica TaxID=2487346 RepID=A0ABX9XJ95_9PSED|nr:MULTISPECIES: hypothetical protein [Pseudomonas]MBA6420662.1 hypothetical protein [Pseudomonas sp. 5Ae-yellow]ROZ83942.1 hypothetical protein EF099_08765 [Pseudomonas sp. SSM44]ROZ85831.1 hypothetical protein EF096_07075 [Pseudomonas neustonica]
MAVSVSWIARRWCIVEQDEQQDLFVKDPWHLHLVDINLRLDVPRERTLCGDLLPSRPIYREVSRQVMAAVCPACLSLAGELRKGRQPVRPRAAAPGQDEHPQIVMTMCLPGVNA